jgi:hypothetical protein
MVCEFCRQMLACMLAQRHVSSLEGGIRAEQLECQATLCWLSSPTHNLLSCPDNAVIVVVNS